ncbi:hypothetical protein BKK79_34475 [Cupriavidus sp. USMAA2-4]|uniref:alpha/beta hydrolase n=1 Tax=unclassified Cupriavidus TaxID=2640874 RepID=UPI0008A6E983|nr:MULTISPECIES: alpha/beta hydrolase [unclassified Cupriavidus]AOY96629.1 hypothetical protein BKK79_34475 [Cupriavidus sp. USMAA2-4]AOZ02965.1 hypothetical protein BKK81_27800 [Cupriavidus sp. USMAHM13]
MTRPSSRKPFPLARWLAGAACAALLVALGREALYLAVEHGAFQPSRLGPLTPEDFGVPSQQSTFDSGDRTLHASFVRAAERDAPALLVYHGDDESLSDWARAQALLYRAGISSFVFDYSGYGASSGHPTVRHLEEDGRQAYQRFLAATAEAPRRYVLGYSLGTGVLLGLIDTLRPAPAGVVIAAGFSSARAAAVATGIVPPWLAPLLPNPWDNEARVHELGLPLLLVHSRSDEVIPFAQAERLARAATGPHRLLALDGLVHNAAIEADEAAIFWSPIAASLRSGALAVAPPAHDARPPAGTPARHG